MFTAGKTPYITPHAKGYQVRLPKRAGGKTRFFSFDVQGPLPMKARALKEAVQWRDDQFNGVGQSVFARVVNDLNAGVFKLVTRTINGTLQHYMVAVWMSEEVQVKRLFSITTYGREIAGALAHIARDIGVLVEADRLEQVGTTSEKRNSKKWH